MWKYLYANQLNRLLRMCLPCPSLEDFESGNRNLKNVGLHLVLDKDMETCIKIEDMINHLLVSSCTLALFETKSFIHLEVILRIIRSFGAGPMIPDFKFWLSYFLTVGPMAAFHVTFLFSSPSSFKMRPVIVPILYSFVQNNNLGPGTQ